MTNWYTSIAHLYTIEEKRVEERKRKESTEKERIERGWKEVSLLMLTAKQQVLHITKFTAQGLLIMLNYIDLYHNSNL